LKGGSAPTMQLLRNNCRIHANAFAILVAASGRAMNGGGFPGSTVAVKLHSALEIVPQEAEIFLATIPAVVAFAAKQKMHESRPAYSPHGVSARRACRHATLFIGYCQCGHRIPRKRRQLLKILARTGLSVRA
jgi:hypothetical protein